MFIMYIIKLLSVNGMTSEMKCGRIILIFSQRLVTSALHKCK